jgi:hypothetical protein
VSRGSTENFDVESERIDSERSVEVEYVAFYAAWNPLKVSSARGTFVTRLGKPEVSLCQQAQANSSVYAVESPLVHARGTLTLTQLGESEVALCQQAQANSSVYAIESPFYSAVESPLIHAHGTLTLTQLGKSEVALCQQAQADSSVYAIESPFYSDGRCVFSGRYAHDVLHNREL